MVKQYIAPTFDVNLDPNGLLIDLNRLYATFARLTDNSCCPALRIGSVFGWMRSAPP